MHRTTLNNTPRNRPSIHAHRTHDATLIVAAVTGLCVLGCAAALVPTGVLVGLGVTALAVWAARRVVRVVRWRREDRADARAAAAWRAAHPQPVGTHSQPVGTQSRPAGHRREVA